jgi:choice-of-anchor A domain-containing protein
MNSVTFYARRAGFAALFAMAASMPAKADVMPINDILSQFNAVVTGTFTSTADVEGRIAVGDLTGGAQFDTNPRGAASSLPAITAMEVTGCNNCKVNNGGNVSVVNSNSGSFVFNGGGKLVSPSFTMSDLTTPLNALQTQLSGMASTASYTYDASNHNYFDFILPTTDTGEVVFNITDPAVLTALEDASTINFVNENTSFSDMLIIINVSASTFAQSGSSNFNADTYLNEHVIWNFEDATSLSFKYWHGAVLAGDASVTNTSPIEGFLYAKDFTGSGELHDYPLDPIVPSVSNFVTPVPEASTWAMMALGFGGLGFAALRKTRKSAAVA